MIYDLATFAVTLTNTGSQLVIQFSQTLERLNENVTMVEFLTTLTGNILRLRAGAKDNAQTPEMVTYPHQSTMLRNPRR
jgi:hypothetical protein